MSANTDTTLEYQKGGRVCCIIVNWNGSEDTLCCLRSLEQQTYGALDIIVVDNGSTDSSVVAICRYLNQRDSKSSVTMRLLKAEKNLGFAAGNNLGIRAALPTEPHMLWLLNNDTECPPDTLAKLLHTAADQPAAGLIGSVLFYADDPSRVQAWGGGHAWPSVAYTTHFRSPRLLRPNDYLTFASVLVRPAMLREIGLLSEEFFMYFEDVELCLRAQAANWRLAIAAETAILHRVGGSSTGARRPELERSITASGVTLIRKYGRWPSAGIILFVGGRLVRRLLHGEWSGLEAVWAGAMQAAADKS